MLYFTIQKKKHYKMVLENVKFANLSLYMFNKNYDNSKK